MTIEFNQTPLDDMVVVEMIQTTPDVIKLPEWQKYMKGKVIAVGPGKPLYTGGRGPMECKVGDIVTFSPTAGMDSDFGVGNKVRMMHDDDVDTIEEAA